MLAIGVTTPLVIALTTFVRRSRLGKAMRATAQDPEAARLMGINVDTTISVTFLLGGMLAGAAGLIYALYETGIRYDQGFRAGLIAFTAAVMGGIGNLWGAVLGGLIIGGIQQISRQPHRRAVDARDRVRLPRPDHGVPAAGPARRGDAGGRMSRLAELRNSRRANWIAGGVVLLFAIVLPLFLNPLNGFIDRSVIALAYVVMALGLNVVVGFAGLLDLGYVAFYAIGAYSAGWFASDYFSGANNGKGVHVLVQGKAAESSLSHTPTAGIHLNFLMILVIAVCFTALAGIIIGLPTLRLRGDYIAIVTLAFGEIVGTIAVNGDQIAVPFTHNATLTNGQQAISPLDPLVAAHPGGVQPGHQHQTLLLGRARPRRVHAVRQLPPARLAPRPGVDRAARGRGRGRQHGRAARAHQAAGLRDRRRARAAWRAPSSATTSTA